MRRREGLQCIERAMNPIPAARAHLVPRAEDQGNMHQRGTHHVSVTENDPGSESRRARTYRTEIVGVCLAADEAGRSLE